MKKWHNARKLVLCATVAVTALSSLTGIVALAQDEATINQIQNDINSKEAYLQTLTATKEELLAEVDVIRQNIQQLANEKAVAEANLEKINLELEQINAEIVVVQDNIAKRSAKIIEQAKYLQVEAQKTDFFSILLSSSSFSEVISRMDAASEVVNAHQLTLAEQKRDEENLEALRQEVVAKQAAAEQERNNIIVAENNAKLNELELVDKLDTIAQKFELTEQEKANLEAQYAVAVEAKRRADEERARQAEEARLAAERAAAEEAARQRQQQQPQVVTSPQQPVVAGSSTSSSGFIMPASGYISSPFGYRSDPFTGASTFHNGIDIAGSGAIVAVQGGTVTRASYGGDYGYYVDITHSNGLMTRYAHLTAGLRVAAGQTVSQGQVIGTMGSTGRSTGVHLHFEVWQNGGRVNPSNYLP